jgi:putative ABC transport system permease protein
MWRLTVKNLRANLTRLVATAVAVIAGTAFVSTGLVLTQAISNATAGNVALQYDSVDVAVTAGEMSERGGTGGVDAAELEEIRALPQVKAAEGELAESTQLLDDGGDAVRSQSLGRIWFDDDGLNPFSLEQGSAPSAAGEVVLDTETAEKAGVGVGDDVELATPSGPAAARVVGFASFGESASVDGGGTIFFSSAEGLEVLGAGSGQYSRILVRTDGSEGAEGSIEEAVPAGLRVQDGEAFREDTQAVTDEFTDFLRPVLLGFAFLALFVAGFVIYNTFTVVVTQRSRELALIRSIGGTPAQVRRSLLGEGLLLGLLASAAGLLTGVLLGLVVQWVLDRFDVPIPSAGIALTPTIVIVTLVAGTLITVVAVMLPAFRAGRTRPVEAMRSAAVDTSGTSAVRMWVGGILLAIGLASLLVNRFTISNPLVLGLGALVLFLGVVIGGPLLARLMGRAMKSLLGRSLTGRIAADNMARNPRRTATTANALVIGLFLVTLVTVSGTAFRDWLVGELNEMSSSDFVVLGATPVPEDVVDEISDIEGVTGVAAVRTAELDDGTGSTDVLSGADIDELIGTSGLTAQSGSLQDVADGKGAATFGLDQEVFESGGPDAGGGSTTTAQPGEGEDGPPLDIGDSGTTSGSASLGDVYTFVDPDGNAVRVPVAATLEFSLGDLFLLFLGTIVNEETFEAIAGDQPVTQLFVRADQAQIDDVGTALDNVLADYTGIEAVPGNFIGQLLGNVIDFLIAAVNGLLGLSVVIALVGIVNTMNLSIFERRRELGMVRALGMTKSQVRSMVRAESFLIGILGTLVGVVSGVFLGWVVVGSVADSVDLSLNWGRVGLIVLAGVVISVLASLWPARKAVQVEMLEAMAAT